MTEPCSITLRCAVALFLFSVSTCPCCVAPVPTQLATPTDSPWLLCSLSSQAEALAKQLLASKSSELDASVLKAFSSVAHFADAHSNTDTRELRAWEMAKTAFQLSRLHPPTPTPSSASRNTFGGGAGSADGGSGGARKLKANRSRRPSVMSALRPSQGSTVRTKDVERAVALAEHAREQAIARSALEERSAARMVRVLSNCKEVQRKRMTFAWKALVRQMIGFFLVMVMFGIMTPTAHDCTSCLSALGCVVS